MEAKKELSVLEAAQKITDSMSGSEAPLAAQIYEAFDAIEALQEKGYSINRIVGDMNKLGVKLSVAYFKTILRRIRLQRKTKGKKTHSAKSTTSPSSAQPVFEVAAPAQAEATQAVKEVVATAQASTLAAGDTQQQNGKSKVRLALEKSRDDPSIDELFQGR